MATLQRYRIPWTGSTGLPGLSVFYSTGGTDATADLLTFFNACKAIFAAGTSWAVLNSGDTINDADGVITGSWIGTGGGVVTSTGSGSYAAGGGAYINWQTASIVAGRRLKGRTFMAPLLASVYDTNGTITTPNLTILGNAATALAVTGKMRIWSRPGGNPVRVGSSGVIASATVPDQVTSLKSRRV